jgi:glycosyltransferase involved in cell wall biosynthesis
VNILLAQATVFVPAWGGANKSNLLILKSLITRGHKCALVAPALGVHGCRNRVEFELEIEKRRMKLLSRENGVDVLEHDGLRLFAAAAGQLASVFRAAIEQLCPDCILVASEDPGQILLQAALDRGRAPVVYLARTTLALPFGPESPMASRHGIDLLRRVSGIVAVSRYLTEYFARWGGFEAVELPLCPNGPGPFPHLARFGEGFVSMVNPCAYKGISIFAALARSFPQFPFAIVPGWGTTGEDLSLLESLQNVERIPPSDDIEDVLRQTRVLLVPSLWAEAKANMITEAMLRGIPVLASDVGGNSEALLGLNFLLPVNPAHRFRDELDERLLPVVDVPNQNLHPWQEALGLLLADRNAYQCLSLASQKASTEANHKQDVSLLEGYLAEVVVRARPEVPVDRRSKL